MFSFSTTASTQLCLNLKLQLNTSETLKAGIRPNMAANSQLDPHDY